MGAAPQIDISTTSKMFGDFTATISVCAAMFGMHLVSGFATLYVLVHRFERRHSVKHITYVSVLLALGIINLVFFVLTMRDGMTLISTSLQTSIGRPEEIPMFGLMHGISAFIITALTEAYLVYRCYIIWDRRWTTIVLPVAILIAVIVLGCWNLAAPPNTFAYADPLWENSNHTSAVFDIVELSPFTYPLPVIYWGLCLLLNIGLTGGIVVKLFLSRRVMLRCYGPDLGKIYTGLAAMLIESSLLYSLVTGLGYPLLPQKLMGNINMFSPLLAQTECIASELIILRFALGRAWTDETACNAVASARDETGPIATMQQLPSDSTGRISRSSTGNDVLAITKMHSMA